MFETWKTVFTYINTFLSDPPLIKTLRFINTLSPPPDYSPPLFGTGKSIFFKIGVFFVITGCGKKKWNVRFLVWCAGVAVCDRLVVVSVRLLVVCSRLLVVFGRLWWFLVVCVRCLFKKQGYHSFPQRNIPFKFSRIKHRSLVITVNGHSKWCEINTVSIMRLSLKK